MRAPCLLWTACNCLLAFRAQSQSRLDGGLPPLQSDRPGFSDGVSIVPRGMVQFEGGHSVSLTRNGDPVEGESTFALGSSMVRAGIARRLELRFGGDGLLDHDHRIGSSRHHITGLADYSAGFKVALREEGRRTPALSVITAFSMPMGAPAFTSDGVDPTVKLAWAKSIFEDLVLSGNLNAALLTGGEQKLLQRAVSFQVSHPVGQSAFRRMNLGGFVETYVVQTQGGAGRVWTFDCGVARPLGRRMQLDVSVGQQMAPMIRHWFVAAGFVVRGSFLRGERFRDVAGVTRH